MRSPSCPWTFLLAVFLFSSWCLPPAARGAAPPSQGTDPPLSATVAIPGPLRSFLRMAAISQNVSPEEVLPLLAHNVVMEGYVQKRRDRKTIFAQPTEYLKLLENYVKQARELKALAGAEGVIRISNCPQAQPLLTILGYRLTAPCGSSPSVETADPDKAFLTVDSGFPLADLEQALRAGKPFVYSFPTSKVPVLFSQGSWMATGPNQQQDVLDLLIHDPELARLYWALAQIDENTQASLRQSPGLPKLLPVAPVLDYYGSQICIRSGEVVVPGGATAKPAWKDLVGASPDSPGEFIAKLLEKDEGWLAAYFDALSRAGSAQQAYFTGGKRLRFFYEALRGKEVLPGPARPAFRQGAGLVLLATQLQLEPSGRPHLPGGLQIWKEILGRERKSESKIVRTWANRASGWKDPDQIVACLIALSRMETEKSPLQLYLTLNEIDRVRPASERLSPETARLLGNKYSLFGDQYRIFAEFHALNNQSMTRFLNVAESLDRIRDAAARADAVGIFQANVGLWQILARQGQIPQAAWNQSWQQVLKPFAGIRSSVQLFDAAQSSLGALWQAAAADTQFSENELVDLLAGPNQASLEAQQVRQAMALKIRSVLNAQRLVSLDSLFALGDGLKQMAHGNGLAAKLLPLAGELREFQPPKPVLPAGERSPSAYTVYDAPHLKAEMQTDISKILRSPDSPAKLAAARGRLVPFLRDTLVGLNYAYYAPPGAQMLYNNPLLVRSHNFSSQSRPGGDDESWATPSLFGRGFPTSGGAHLVGSLANLPYVLATVEQNFIIPKHVQALIWEDMVPSLLTGAVLPRWWRVTRNELHAAALYQSYGEELLAAAARNEQVRRKVMGILAHRMLPRRSEEVEEDLRAGRAKAALYEVAPGETFYLAAEFRRRFPQESHSWGKAGKDLDALAQHDPEAVSLERLSRDFGVPHPALEQTYACALGNARPLPTYFGYSSRLLAESWDSNNLYWARLADESGYPPVMLNLLVPELTHRMVENIFATYLGDWPSLLRALRETGNEFQQGKIASLPRPGGAAPL